MNLIDRIESRYVLGVALQFARHVQNLIDRIESEHGHGHVHSVGRNHSCESNR